MNFADSKRLVIRSLHAVKAAMSGSDAFEATGALNEVLRYWRHGRPGKRPKFRGLASFLRDEVQWRGKLCLVDVGARGDILAEWQASRECLTCIGFEPDAKECQALNEAARQRGEPWLFLPVAIGAANGVATLYLTRFPPSTGIVPTDAAFLKRMYPILGENLAPHGVLQVDVRSLDTALRRREPPITPDFLKIDVEGAEADVIKGAAAVLEQGTILGVLTEVGFGPLKKPDELSEIEHLMRAAGFFLYRIETSRYPRATFPQGVIEWSKRGVPLGMLPRATGQILSGDLLYLRDPIWEAQQGLQKFRWEDESVLKMLLVFEVYGLYDCAIELIRYYNERSQTSLPIESICDVLTPLLPNGKRVSYREYCRIAATFPNRERDAYEGHWGTKGSGS